MPSARLVLKLTILTIKECSWLCAVTIFLNHLLFRRNNTIWQIGLVCKASSAASHQIRWHNKKVSIKGSSVLRDFSWIENYKLYKHISKTFLAGFAIYRFSSIIERENLRSPMDLFILGTEFSKRYLDIWILRSVTANHWHNQN